MASESDPFEPTLDDSTDVDEAIRTERGAFGVIVWSALIPCLFIYILLQPVIDGSRELVIALMLLPFFGAALWPLFRRWQKGIARTTPEGVRLTPTERNIAFAVVALIIAALLFAPLF